MSTPTTPGLYLDAAAEVWRVRRADEPCAPVSFDELLEQAMTQPAELAARSGPFTPLLPLTVPKQDLLLEALAELHHSLSKHGRRFSEQLDRIAALADEIEGLG